MVDLSRRHYLLACLLAASACDQATGNDPAPSNAPLNETREQSLGEATQAYYFEGEGAGAMPSMEERQAWQLFNQVRMNADVYEIVDMNDQPIPPQPPMSLQPGMVEVGRWQGQHALANTCFCATNMDGAAEAAPAGNAPFSCCTLGYVEGTIRCVGPVIECGEDGMTTANDRWGTLNRGAGEIQNEIYFTTDQEEQATGLAAAEWALGGVLGTVLRERTGTGAAARVSVGVVPEECKPPEDTCAPGGNCVGPAGQESCDPADPDAPNECIGTCDRGPKAGEFCTIPEPVDPAACDPENYPRAYWWSFMFGKTSEPPPVFADVIHTNLAEGQNSVAVNFYDPLGDPELLQIATDSGCNDLERTFVRPGDGNNPGGDAGTDGGTSETVLGVGNTYHWDVDQTGCIRYIAYAIDSEGFTHTYPTYGSLGMNLAADGVIIPNDETCPIWVPDERPNPSCLPDADECTEGATRVCYTGRPGTEDKGICDVGTETCRDGRWSGLCEGETRPEPTDTCGDGEDQNCNGFADDNCPVPVDQTPDAGSGGADMGNGDGGDAGSEPVADSGGTSDPDKKDDDDGGGCCATVSHRPDHRLPAFFALLLGALALRRRREP